MERATVPLLALLAACGGGADTGVVCPTIGAASVEVTVEDAGGAPLPDARVRFRAPDADIPDWTDCEAWPDAEAAWVCGWGVIGTVELDVSADGWGPWSGAVDVPAADPACGTPEMQVVEVQLPAKAL